MIIAIDRIIFQLTIFYDLYRNKNFTDSGLTNFRKSLENHSSIKFYFFKFFLVMKKINMILQLIQNKLNYDNYN